MFDFSCPRCGATYQVSEDKIGAGINVRCAACTHEWFQQGAVAGAPSAAPVTPAQATEPAIPESSANIPSPPSSQSPVPPAPEERPKIPVDGPSDWDIDTSVGSALSEYLGDVPPVKTQARPPKKRRRWILWLIILLILLLGIGAGAFFFRKVIVEYLPMAEGAYEMLNVPVSDSDMSDLFLPGSTFQVDEESDNPIKLSGLTSMIELIDGTSALVVRGVFENNSPRDIPVPNFAVTVVSGEGDEIARWQVSLTADVIPAYGELPFVTRRADWSYQGPASVRVTMIEQL
ncbi:MAG: zinc-ribbon domain-containing protein [Pseudomonadota bacterium]